MLGGNIVVERYWATAQMFSDDAVPQPRCGCPELGGAIGVSPNCATRPISPRISESTFGASMGAVNPAHDDQPYPQRPMCASMRSRLVPVADPPPNNVHLHCDTCQHVWPVQVKPFEERRQHARPSV
jgi:hypothetical protein